MSKFENFPVLKEGDLVVCGKRNGFLMTGRGAYVLEIFSEGNSDVAKITENVANPKNVLELNAEYRNSFYIPQAVFRPPAGKLIDWYALPSMLTDPEEWITEDSDYTCVWSQGIDDAKELTVDEVSELLGYRVKIVGKENK